MDAITLINKPCRLCGRTTAMWCGRCQNAWYCSPEHLQSVCFPVPGVRRSTLTLTPRQDWSKHRSECVAIPTPTHTTVPTGKCQTVTASALFFGPGDGNHFKFYLHSDDWLTLSPDGPRTVGVSCAVVDGTACPSPIVKSYFTENQPYAVILTQGLNGEPLRYPLHIFYCPLSLSRGSPVNGAIKRITGGGQAKKPWCGPVLVMRFNGSRRQGYSDATTSDFTALSSYFLAYK